MPTIRGGFSTVTAIFPARIFKILCGFFRPEFSYIFSGSARLTLSMMRKFGIAAQKWALISVDMWPRSCAVRS